MFVAFEGMDGSGKSTAAANFCDLLREKGHTVRLVQKRSADFGSVLARGQLEHIKNALWDYPADFEILEMGNEHWLFLMASWFTALAELVVKPAHETGEIVVVDNWFYKFAARFALKNNQALLQLAKTCFGVLPVPDLTIFLEMDAALAAQRKNGRFLPSECGVLETGGLPNAENFIRYQNLTQATLKQTLTGQRTAFIAAEQLGPMEVAVQALVALEACEPFAAAL